MAGSAAGTRRLRRTLEALQQQQQQHAPAAAPMAEDESEPPEFTTLYIVRHGETEWNREGKLQGSVDTALNEAGVSQAEEVAQVLASWPCDAIASSPMQRTAITATAIRRAHDSDLPMIMTFAGLAECNAGELQTRFKADPDVVAAIEECDEQWAAGNLEFPYPGEGGESPAQVIARACAALADAATLGSNVIVACHGMVLRCIACHCLGCGWAEMDSLPITNCCVSEFVYNHKSGVFSAERDKLFQKLIQQSALSDVQAAAASTPTAPDAAPAAPAGGAAHGTGHSHPLEARLKRVLRPVRGFPRPNATFADCTPLLADASLFKAVIDAFVYRYRDAKLAAIAAPEARGFFFGPAVAAALGVAFLPIRKPEQLPGPTHVSAVQQMDYGERQMEVHSNVLPSGWSAVENRVAVVDDLLATGGSLLACVDVLEKLELHVVEAACVYDFNIGGGEALAASPHYGGVPVFKLADFFAGENPGPAGAFDVPGRWFLERGTEEEAAATVSPHMGETLKTGSKS